MLGVVFVLLVCFLRHGLIGGIKDLYDFVTDRGNAASRTEAALHRRHDRDGGAEGRRGRARQMPPRRRMPAAHRETDGLRPDPASTGLTKRYGGLLANSDIDFTVTTASCAASSVRTAPARRTFFKMLTCEVPPTSGKIVFEGRDITGMSVTDVCQLGLTKSYQVNQLFTRLTVRENLTIAALAELRGKFRLDMFRAAAEQFPASPSRSRTRWRWSTLPSAPTRRYRSSPTARSGGSKSALRWRPRRACCCSTSRSPA